MSFIKEKKILICVGIGGVGKTTVSAALALEGAIKGRNTLALTVDPSRRLATSLGISSKDEMSRIGKERITEIGSDCEGELHVNLLDVKKTFDRLIEDLASTEREKEKILSNTYYQNIADSLAGSHEYMAMEALLRAHEDHEHDLIVVDTPPSQHIEDFLTAPKRLVDMLDSKLVKSYSLMNRFTFGFARIWSSLAVRFLEAVVGAGVLEDVWQFFTDFEAVGDSLKKRFKRTHDLLRSSECGFLIVTVPKNRALYESFKLYKSLDKKGFDVGGIIANRVFSLEKSPNIQSEVKDFLEADKDLASKVIMNYRNYKKVGISDMNRLNEFRKKLDGRVPVISVPYLSEEVYDLNGLHKIRDYIVSSNDN